MAARSVTISNTLESIGDGTIQGTFSPDRLIFSFPEVTYLDSKGRKHSWTIQVSLYNDEISVPILDEYLISPVKKLPASFRAKILVNTFQVGGKTREVEPTFVREGKNIGKKSETNAITQAIRDALSLHNKHSRKVDTTTEANIFDPRPPPMLARKYGDTKDAVVDYSSPVYIQPKLNGVHIVIYLDSTTNNIVRYSRTSLDYNGLSYISDEVKNILTSIQSSDIHLDGEIYIHGKDLNWISGQTRKDDDSKDLEFHIFDCFWPLEKFNGIDRPYSERMKYLEDLFKETDGLKIPHPHIKLVPTYQVNNYTEMKSYLTRFLNEENLEGIILRKPNAGYRYSYNNYHCTDVLKIKPTFDMEVRVIGYKQGTKGKDVGAIIWICQLMGDDLSLATFDVVPKNMTYEERYKIFDCLVKNESYFDLYLRDKKLTVEYQELSAKTGIPLRAKALLFREYENPTADSPRKFYELCGIKEN